MRLVHVFNGGFGVGVVVVEDVCGAAVGSEGSVHWKVEVVDWTKLAEYLKEMVFVDVLGEPLHHNLCVSGRAVAGRATVPAAVSASVPTAAPVTAITARRGV